jgi:hypothetical protein
MASPRVLPETPPMSAVLRALALSLALFSASGAARAEDVSLGGFICARPLSPACADQPETLRAAGAVSACKREVESYAAATGAYRDCLERQITLALRHANEVLDRFRCASQPGAPCPSNARASQRAAGPPLQ